MKYIFIINAVAFLLGCGSYQLSEQAGSVQSVRIPKLNSVSEALAFLRTHPAIKTTGIPLALLVAELGIPPKQLGRYINVDSYLVTELLQVAGKSSSIIFAKGSTPREQVDAYIGKLDAEMLRSGVPIAQVEDNVKYQQDGWSSKEVRKTIGQRLDKERYVTHLVGRERGGELYIFFNGDEPPKQIATYLDSLPQEKLEEGIPIAQIVDNVSYTSDSRSDWSKSIGYYLDRENYVVVRLAMPDGTRKSMVFPKGADPSEQIAVYLKSLDPKMLKSEGVPIAQVVAAVNYTRNLSPKSSNMSVGINLDKEKYFVRLIKINGNKQLFIFPRYVQRLVGIGGEYEEFTFAEDDTPNVRISAYLEKLAPEKLKQGVSVAQVGNNIVKYGRDDWSREDFHTSISLYLDRDKYTTTFIIVNGKAETYIFAKDFTPHAQIRNYLKSLDPKMLKSEGVSVVQVGNNVSYRQQGQSSEDFYRAIRWYVHGREGYVSRMTKVDKEKHESSIFTE